jgi:alkyl hydroperoxide reductase subunit F
MYDLIIIGGGPAGVAAGVYASRKKLKTLFLTESFGGQSIVSDGIENWIGTIRISGNDLAKNLEAHLRAYAGDIVDIKTGTRVQSVEKLPVEDNTSDISGHVFKVVLTPKKSGKPIVANSGNEAATATLAEPESFITHSILIATGSKRRKLEAINADKFEHKGLTYCATCDGPVFADQDVAVIGGGNAAFESAAQLAAYCKSVAIINRSDVFRADPITVEKILAKPNVRAITDTIVEEIKGETFVNGLRLKNAKTGEATDLAVTGVFVEIGLLPNTDFVSDLVERDAYNKIKVNPMTQSTSEVGIWSAGDCTDGLYHQNNIAAGDAVKALEDIYGYVSKK